MTRRPKGRRRLCITRGQWRDRARTAEHQLDGAGHLIEGLRLQIEELEVRLTARDEANKARLAQKKADAIDVGSLQQELKAAADVTKKLTAEYLAVKADLENRTAIDVPSMHRDTTDPNDQCTEAIYVQTLRDHMAKQGPPVKTLIDALGGAA